ncbi:hypothetical protein [Hymenobacter rubidus]|uniref:hypothetical protein n=1 Tax=Hymenobacter rubidus TaxID=1441626 RepID=UPI00191EA77E|nr:hypothetical protein [Hymenobacter rubidus]
MPTSYSTFCALPHIQQVPLVWAEGTFIARRWEEEDGVSLYHMDGGFFCEVYLNPDSLEILQVQAFTTDSERLEDYACYVTLDDLADPNR